MAGRQRPNVLITGTPGTGKTTLAEDFDNSSGLTHLNIGNLVKEKNLHDGWGEKFECTLFNEDKVCDEIEAAMDQGGNVVDFHSCDFFPERWFDLVIVLRTDNNVLYPRLEGR